MPSTISRASSGKLSSTPCFRRTARRYRRIEASSLSITLEAKVRTEARPPSNLPNRLYKVATSWLGNIVAVIGRQAAAPDYPQGLLPRQFARDREDFFESHVTHGGLRNTRGACLRAVRFPSKTAGRGAPPGNGSLRLRLPACTRTGRPPRPSGRNRRPSSRRARIARYRTSGRVR